MSKNASKGLFENFAGQAEELTGKRFEYREGEFNTQRAEDSPAFRRGEESAQNIFRENRGQKRLGVVEQARGDF